MTTLLLLTLKKENAQRRSGFVRWGGVGLFECECCQKGILAYGFFWIRVKKTDIVRINADF